MKKLFKDKKTKFTVIFLAALVICVSLVTALVITLYKDYDIKSITVNGRTATIHGETAQVEIEQSETVNINIKYKSDIQVKIYKDESFKQELQNFNNIRIDGTDTYLYITTGAKSKIKKTYTLNIINKVSNDVTDYTINGVAPELSNGGYSVTLPDITTNFNISVKPSIFFSYKFYLDSDQQIPINELSNFILPENQTTIYCDVYNVNFTEVFKQYKIDVQFETTENGKINVLTVNGIQADIGRTEATVTVDRANILNIEITGTETTKFIVYSDKNLTEEISDIKNIQNLNLSGEPIKYYIKAIAANGTELIYTLTVKYNLDTNVEISSLKINDTYASVNDDEISVLLERPNYITVDATCASPYAKIEFYFDNGHSKPLTDLENIDISDYDKPVYQLFAKVTAEAEAVKNYKIFINFVLSNKAELLDLQANNQTATIENGAATLQYIGTPDTFNLLIQNVTVSKYAAFDIFYDTDCTNPIDYKNEIQLTSNHQTLYIKITAEDNHYEIIPLTINLVSNDNEIKSITVNNQEFIITSETSTLTVENNVKLQINQIKYDLNSELDVFYDQLQTNAVENLNDIDFKNNIGQVYIRVIAETGAIKVFSIEIIIKNAPTPVFSTSSIQMNDWQKTVPVSELFYIEGNSYNENQFEYEVYWNDSRQNTDYISVANEKKIYELKIIVKSYYFEDVTYTKLIEILPFTLTPVTASLLINEYATKDFDDKLPVHTLIDINYGSYVLGKDFYIEINYPNARRQVVIDLNAQIDLYEGTYAVFINAFNNYFDTKKLGELTITEIKKDIPVITAPDFIEIKESDNVLNIAGLFEVSKNDYDVILIKTFSNDKETDSIKCNSGIYLLKLQAYYTDGVVEKIIKVEISSISDNTDIDLFVNDNLILFTNNLITLPDLKYNDKFVLTGQNYNSHAKIVLKVNDILSSFGKINLNTGANIISIVVTAESGSSETYEIYVNKKARELPEVIAPAHTVKLSKYQDFINVENFYTVNSNDYLAKVNLYLDNLEILNNILEVENISKIYNVEIVLTGEFGNISTILEIGVLPYTEIEVRFNSSAVVKENQEYIFSLTDFVNEILYYGIDAETCRLELICDNKTFSTSALEAGEHLFTINIWQDNILLKEETRWFNVTFSKLSPRISVVLKNSNVIIPQKTFIAELENYFEIDYGIYDKNSLAIRFIYADSVSPQDAFILQKGKNYFTLQIIEKTSRQELYRNEYVITCSYISNSESVFKTFSINNVYYNITENNLIIITHSPITEAALSYAVNDTFSVFNIPDTLNLSQGLNQIQYRVKETDGSSYTAVINIYNICKLEYYISSVNYKGHSATNNILQLDAGTVFNINELSVAYNNAEHIAINKTLNQIYDNIFDVRIEGAYDNIDIGYIVIRIYIGNVKPRLFEIATKVTGDSVFYYGISEYGLEIFSKNDSLNLDFSIDFVNNNFSVANSSLTNLDYGVNNLKLIVKEDNIAEYEYNLNVTLVPCNMFLSVSYNENKLSKTNNYYIIENSNTIDENLVFITLKDIPINTTLHPLPVTYYNEKIAIKYELYYKQIIIQTICVAVANNNAAVTCERDNLTLTQLGNNILYDEIRIRKYESVSEINYSYIVSCIYPLTHISDERFSYEEYIGYVVDVDLSYLLSKEPGTYTHLLEFNVYTVSSSFTYTLRIDIELYQISADNAELSVNIGENLHLYFEESELSDSYIVANQKIDLNIQVENIDVSINSKDNKYHLYYNKDIVNNLNVEILYDINSGYYIQFNIGSGSNNLKTIRIYLNEYRNDNGETVETSCFFGEQQINILENADTENIEYNNQTYNVAIGDKTLYLPQNTAEINVKIYGYIAESFNFVFKDNNGNAGILEIIDGCIVLIISEDNPTPYALIKVQFV